MLPQWIDRLQKKFQQPWAQYLIVWIAWMRYQWGDRATVGHRSSWKTLCLASLLVQDKVYWREVEAHAPYPEQEDWVENGFVWKGGLNGEVLPTCMKSIPRTVPPPKPAGLEKTSPQARQRWIDDSYRYPPYQYQDRFIFTSADSWRLVNANETPSYCFGMGNITHQTKPSGI